MCDYEHLCERFSNFGSLVDLLATRLVIVHSKRQGKLFDRRTGKAEFKFSIGADFLNQDITRHD
jgi:hypothetical protein